MDEGGDGIGMFGLCFGVDIGAFSGLTGSVCVAVDRHGVGVLETGGYHEGATFGAFFGGGMIVSNGDMEDQKKGFKYNNVAVGKGLEVSGTYSYGQSAVTGEDVWSLEIPGAR